MKIWLRNFLFLLIFLCESVSAQDQRVADSLIDVYSAMEEEDSNVHLVLNRISFNHSNPSKSLIFAEKIIELAKVNNDVKKLFQGHYLVGMANNRLGNLDDAVSSFLEAGKCAQAFENYSGLGQVYLNLADTYCANNNKGNAIKYYQKALSVLQDVNDSLSVAGALTNLGFVYYLIDGYDSALNNYDRATKIFQTLSYEVGVLYCLGNTGLVYAKMGKSELAESNIREAIDGLRRYEDYYAISDFEKEIADIYRQRGDYDVAKKYALHSLLMSDSLGLKIQARDAAYELYEIFLDSHEYETAIDYLNKYYALRDTITNAENIQRIADMRTEYEVGQKQAEVDLLTAEQEAQRVLRIALSLGLGLVVVFAFVQLYNNRQKQKVNKALNEQKQKLEELNQTKDRFFSIISHDLRGPVSAFNGISRMIKLFVKQKQIDQLDALAEDIDKSVDRLSTLLDNLLNWAVQQQGSFPYVPEKLNVKVMAEELVGIFANMAQSKDLSLTAEVNTGVMAWADYNTTMTIIRNLVSNALKFTPKQGLVKVAAEASGGLVTISVSDTGVGIPAEKINNLFKLQAKKSTWGTDGEKGLGLGLQLVQEFVELNQGSITVESSEGEGTIFKVSLPAFEAIEIDEKAAFVDKK